MTDANETRPRPRRRRTPRPTRDAHAKAQVLIESLPWLKRFHGETIVVKFGGNAMVSAELQRAFAEDMVYLRYAGIKPVVVHGGGPQISAMLDAARHRERVPRRLPRDDARDDGRRAHGAHRARSTASWCRSSTSTARSPPASPARTPGCSPGGGAGRWSTATRSTSGSSATSSSVDPAAVHAQLDAGRIPVVSSIAPDGDDAGPVAQRQRRLRGRLAGRRPRRGEARRSSPMSRASTATGRTATRSSRSST